MRTLAIVVVALALSACQKTGQNMQPQTPESGGGQTSSSSESAVPSTAATVGSSDGLSEFDLANQVRASVREYAEDWQAKMESQGKSYRTSIGTAAIVGKPGQSNYTAAYDLALKSAILDAHSNYVSEIANNEINQVIQKYTFQRDGVSPAEAEAICKEANADNVLPKLKELANALADKAIEKLGGIPDHSNDLDTAIRCRYQLMVNRVSKVEEVAHQQAIRGGRLIRMEAQGGAIAVAMTYGASGLEIADTVKAQRIPASPNPNAREEIKAWVQSNILAADDVMTVIGVHGFKLSNGEYAVVSIGVADLPISNGQMSQMEMQFRAQNAYPRADTAAMAQIEEFIGAAVSDTTRTRSIAEEGVSLDTVIKDGTATARTETQSVKTVMVRETTSISRGTLRGVVTVTDGTKASKSAGESIVYVVRGWSPSLLARAQADVSDLAKDHSVQEQSANQGPSKNADAKKSKSPELKEDF